MDVFNQSSKNFLVFRLSTCYPQALLLGNPELSPYFIPQLLPNAKVWQPKKSGCFHTSPRVWTVHSPCAFDVHPPATLHLLWEPTLTLAIRVPKQAFLTVLCESHPWLLLLLGSVPNFFLSKPSDGIRFDIFWNNGDLYQPHESPSSIEGLFQSKMKGVYC